MFRDESCHIEFAYAVIDVIREEEPDLFDTDFKDQIVAMFYEAINCELYFAKEILDTGVSGLSLKDMKSYLQYIADIRLERLNIPGPFKAKNPFDFMALQDTQELTNFFERRVAAYQKGVKGEVTFDEVF